MSCITRYLAILVFTTAGLLSLEATAASIDLNDFFGDPEVTIALDGSSAEFVESGFSTFVQLTNDPFLGDPFVIVPSAFTLLTFDYDFNEASGDNDEFSAFLFDANDGGPFFGLLETFTVNATQTGMASFDLEPHVGLTLGLQFELVDLSGGSTDSTVTVSNLALTQVPVPAAVWLFGCGLIGLVGIARKRKVT